MVRILKSLRFPPQNRAILPDVRLPSPPRSLTEMTESRISVILFCKNSFYLQSRPPSSRDVFHRRRLWRIQTMENAEGWHAEGVTEGVVPRMRLIATPMLFLFEGRFPSSPPVADSDDEKRRRLARQRRDGRSHPPSHRRICRSASSFFTPASLSRCASSSSRPISSPG